ncbi:hypothetical protein SCALM49S_06424 [Streptomyces californicus]
MVRAVGEDQIGAGRGEVEGGAASEAPVGAGDQSDARHGGCLSARCGRTSVRRLPLHGVAGGRRMQPGFGRSGPSSRSRKRPPEPRSGASATAVLHHVTSCRTPRAPGPSPEGPRHHGWPAPPSRPGAPRLRPLLERAVRAPPAGIAPRAAGSSARRPPRRNVPRATTVARTGPPDTLAVARAGQSPVAVLRRAQVRSAAAPVPCAAPVRPAGCSRSRVSSVTSQRARRPRLAVRRGGRRTSTRTGGADTGEEAEGRTCQDARSAAVIARPSRARCRPDPRGRARRRHIGHHRSRRHVAGGMGQRQTLTSSGAGP